MIYINAKIIDLDISRRIAFVEPLDKQSCELCKGKGCSTLSISQMFASSRQKKFEVEIDENIQDKLKINQVVTIGIHKKILLLIVFLSYFLPIILATLGAGIGNQINDLYAVIGCCLGLILGFLILKINHLKILSKNMPKIIDTEIQYIKICRKI